MPKGLSPFFLQPPNPSRATLPMQAPCRLPPPRDLPPLNKLHHFAASPHHRCAFSLAPQSVDFEKFLRSIFKGQHTAQYLQEYQQIGSKRILVWLMRPYTCVEPSTKLCHPVGFRIIRIQRDILACSNRDRILPAVNLASRLCLLTRVTSKPD